MANKTAMLVGATGLVGGFLMDLLLASSYYDEVKVLTRRSLKADHPKLRELLVDFDDLSSYADDMVADDVYCCIGTTIKKAKTQERFRKVDHDYPLEVAKIARKNGASQYLLLTAMGADKNSMIFYNRVKGEIEDHIVALGFDTTLIFRPSLLLGKRDEIRPMEKLGQTVMSALDPLMLGPLGRFKAVPATEVANAMLREGMAGHKGKKVFLSDELG